LFISFQMKWETWHSFIKYQHHGHKNFQGLFLVGVWRHSIAKLHQPRCPNK
jgi:hypothetical protein